MPFYYNLDVLYLVKYEEILDTKYNISIILWYRKNIVFSTFTKSMIDLSKSQKVQLHYKQEKVF